MSLEDEIFNLDVTIVGTEEIGVQGNPPPIPPPPNWMSYTPSQCTLPPPPKYTYHPVCSGTTPCLTG